MSFGVYPIRPYTGEVNSARAREIILRNDQMRARDFASTDQAFLVDVATRDSDAMREWVVASARSEGTVATTPVLEEGYPVGPEFGFHFESISISETGGLTRVALEALNAGVDEDDEGRRISGPFEEEQYFLAMGDSLAIAWSFFEVGAGAPVDVEKVGEGIRVRACGQEFVVPDVPIRGTADPLR